jgi:hypothetical protein
VLKRVNRFDHAAEHVVENKVDSGTTLHLYSTLVHKFTFQLV